MRPSGRIFLSVMVTGCGMREAAAGPGGRLRMDVLLSCCGSIQPVYSVLFAGCPESGVSVFTPGRLSGIQARLAILF